MRPLLYSGTEVIAATLPEGARLILPPETGEGIGDVRAAVAQAIQEPVDGKPLSERVNERSRVLLVFDGPAFPVPPMRVDPRVAAIEAILGLLGECGLPLENVSLLCASGVTRLFRNTEIARVAGVPALASHRSACHDAEAIDRLARLGATPQGEVVELDAAVLEADLVITLGLAQAPLQGGWTTLLPGLASTNTAREFLSVDNLAEGPSPCEPTSRFQKALRRAGKVLEKKLDLFHVELAVDTRLWPRAMISLLRPKGEVPRPVAAWNSIPEPIRARASRLFLSAYQTIGVAAGSVGGAHERIRDLLLLHSYSKTDAQADVVMLGVPAVQPHTLNSFNNPVIDVAAAFGYLLAWNAGKPLVKKGGAVVLLAPLHERFDKGTHLPYVEFYERVLPATRDPKAMAERFEGLFAGRPEYVSAYRRRYAYHGVQPFHFWYQACNVLSTVGKVFVVGAERKVAERFGFTAARKMDEALAAAAEFVGRKDATLAVPVMPPAFGISVQR